MLKDKSNIVKPASYDWMNDALVDVCQELFPMESTLAVSGIELLPADSKDYRFELACHDTMFRIILRLQNSMFSNWHGTEDVKVGKEYVVMRHLYRQGYPSPFAYCYSTSYQPFGQPYLLMDPGDGEPWYHYQDSFTHIIENIVDSLATEMAKLHSIELSTHKILTKIELIPFLRKMRSRIKSLRDEELELCFYGCKKQVKKQKEKPHSLLHGALDLDHTLIKNDYIRTIINWEHAAIGDPRWDVAYTALSLERYLDRSFANRFIAHYVQQTGTPLGNMDFWEGLVAFKMLTLIRWLHSLHPKCFDTITGFRTQLLDMEDFYLQHTLRQFI